jgi:hypothetical protein
MFSTFMASLFLSMIWLSAVLANEEISGSLCERHPHLRICWLRQNLDGAINEMDYLVQVIERQQSHLSGGKMF